MTGQCPSVDNSTPLEKPLEQPSRVDQRLAREDAPLTKIAAEYEIMCSRAVDLQREVDRLRQKLLALDDLVAGVQARADEIALLRSEILSLSSRRGYRLLDILYYRHFRNPYIGGPLRATRRVIGEALRRIRGH